MNKVIHKVNLYSFLLSTILDRFAKGMILIGASAWLPYFILITMGNNPEISVFLLIHLSFIIPGVFIKERNRIKNLKKMFGI